MNAWQKSQLPNTATCKIHYYSEDSTLVEEHCELLVLQPCPAPDEVDDVPATPLSRIRCCCASELDSLSSCYTLSCGRGSLVEPVKRKIWLELKKDGHYRNNTDRTMKKIDTKHIRHQGCGAQKRHWLRSRLCISVFTANTCK